MTDKFEKVLVGPVTRNSGASVVVDFPAGDTEGLALDVGASPASGSARAGIKLGGFTLVQDPLSTGDATAFGITDADGVLVQSWEQGVQAATNLAYIGALASAVYHAAVEAGVMHTDAGVRIDDLAAESALALIVARANLLKVGILEHIVSVGTPEVSGAHVFLDDASVATIGGTDDATDLASACTLTNALFAVVVYHAAALAGGIFPVHFHPDTSTITGTPSSDLLGGNATEANCITVLNELLGLAVNHAEYDYASGPYPEGGLTETIATVADGTFAFVNGRLITYTPPA